MRHWDIVPINHLDKKWPDVEPYLKRACEFGFNKQKPSDFLDLLKDDMAQLWASGNAYAITDVIQYSNKRYARVTIGMGENPQDLGSFIVTFEAWAKSMGCDGVQSTMRPGFAPQFADAGWKRTHVMMEKDLSDA